MELYFSLTQGLSDNGICRNIVPLFDGFLTDLCQRNDLSRNEISALNWPNLRGENLGKFVSHIKIPKH